MEHVILRDTGHVCVGIIRVSVCCRIVYERNKCEVHAVKQVCACVHYVCSSD